LTLIPFSVEKELAKVKDELFTTQQEMETRITSAVSFQRNEISSK
jgi:hypothetical protein